MQQEYSMSWKSGLSRLGLFLALSLTFTAEANAASCRNRMGPYQSNYEAEAVAQQARNVGYETSGVWGEGGIVSDWSNRRYFFNVFFPC
jgi:hypothetical protein